jgi:hypothetical protein
VFGLKSINISLNVLKLIQFIFMDVFKLMVLFLIYVYFGGDITFTSQSGTDCTLDSRLTLSGNENTTLEEIKYEIFQGLGFE